jgi:Domain of unknown function (DUF5667)
MTWGHGSQPGSRDEVEDLLALFAARRLAPRYGALGRIRATLFERARMNGRVAGSGAVPRRGRATRWIAAAGLAASLALVGAASVVGAGPASPLYDVRLWVEELTLPAAAADRSEAHRQRLEARLEEAEAAAASGNGAAVAAALAAYRAEVDAALADVSGDLSQLDRLEDALTTHLVVLDVLAERVPTQAADAIAKTEHANSRAVDKIKEQQGGPKGSKDKSTGP